MKKGMLVIAACMVALALGAPAFTTARAQEEEPSNVALYNPSICVALNSAIALACTGSGTPSQIRTIANAYGDDDDNVEPEDFAALDLTLNQLHQDDPVSGTTGLRAVIFVEDDNPIEVEVDDGLLGLLPGGNPNSDSYLCDTQLEDEDCDADGIAGDGVIFVGIFGNGDPLGETRLVIRQGTDEIIQNFTIVGEPDSVEFLALENIAQAGVPADECELATEASAVLAANATAERSVVLAIVRDSEGTAITGAWVLWESSDEDRAVLAQPNTPTIDLGSFGVGAPNILCGTEEPGDVTITGTILQQLTPPNPLLLVDPAAEIDDEEIDWTIRGVAENITLAAAPAQLTCDGVASSAVSATVTDGNGDPVANGQQVRFSVQVLGTANPIVATTTDGVATTNVVPVAVENTGVPVVATTTQGTTTVSELADDDGVDNDEDGQVDESGERDPDAQIPNPDVLQASLLVQCTGAIAAEPTPGGGPAATPTRPVGVRPPDTGSGGDLDGQGALSVWPAFGLVMGALALMGARLALRRS